MDLEHRLRRLRFRAWHRGTKEADLLIGGFCDRYSASWNDDEAILFEMLLDEQDVDVMAWAIGTQPVPELFDTPMMKAMQKLDYVAMRAR